MIPAGMTHMSVQKLDPCSIMLPRRLSASWPRWDRQDLMQARGRALDGHHSSVPRYASIVANYSKQIIIKLQKWQGVLWTQAASWLAQASVPGPPQALGSKRRPLDQQT